MLGIWVQPSTGAVEPGAARSARARTGRALAGHTDLMATVTSPVERTVPAIRVALEHLGTGAVQSFDADFRRALELAGAALDLAPVEDVLDRWWARAVAAANPLSDLEREQLRRAHRGDLTGLLTRTGDGTWTGT